MLWFKHDRNLRNSPPMKSIQRCKGDAGYATAIRLIEVMTEQCGSGENFNPVLMLAPPTTDFWLANEICTPDEKDNFYGGMVSTERLADFLDTFEHAGLIRRAKRTGPGSIKNDKNEWVPSEVTFETIELCNFEQLQDTWTARYQHKGAGQGKGGGGYRATTK